MYYLLHPVVAAKKSCFPLEAPEGSCIFFLGVLADGGGNEAYVYGEKKEADDDDLLFFR